MQTFALMLSCIDNRSLSVDDEEELLYGDSSLVQDAALQEAQLSNIRRPRYLGIYLFILSLMLTITEQILFTKIAVKWRQQPS